MGVGELTKNRGLGVGQWKKKSVSKIEDLGELIPHKQSLPLLSDYCNTCSAMLQKEGKGSVVGGWGGGEDLLS